MLKHWSARGLQIVRTTRSRTSLLIVAGFLVLSSSLAALSATPSFAATIDDGGADNAEGVGGSSVSTCAIEQVGWVICPTLRTMAKLADYGFAFISAQYLEIGYEVSANDSGTYLAWELVRNLANLLFVLAFLYIIYAEITGRNAGSYNIKRILPKLVIGAILVNISYYLCAAAIQASDIVGNIILTILGEEGVAGRIGPAAMSLTNSTRAFEDGILTDLTSNMLTKSGTIWILLAPIAAITISIALVSAAGIVLLIARKVIVAMLVLVSPLLFVAYILPNLEHYFKQWVRLFAQLLLLFPVIAFLLGAGQIISATIIKVGSSGTSSYAVDGDAYQARSGGSGSAMTDLAAAGAAVLPLLGVWFMMKGLSSVMTTAGSRIASGIGRGGSKESAKKLEAKLSNKQGMSSTAGNINIVGGKVNIFDRKPAFTRMTARKRRATPGGSRAQSSKTSPYDGSRTPSAAERALTGAFGGSLMGGSDARKKEEMVEAAEAVAELNNANIAAQQANIAAATQAAQAANGTGKKDDGKSSNQLLSELNKPRQQQSKLSGGGGQANSSGENSGGESGGGKVSDLRAPTMAQPMMEAPVQSSTKPSGGPLSVVTETMPQVDASSLAAPRGVSLQSAPVSEMEQKAKAHAQKYLFESAEEVEKAAQRQEELDEMNKEAAKDLGKNKKKGE